jgi:two-component system sensor histidine kinase TctE
MPSEGPGDHLGRAPLRRGLRARLLLLLIPGITLALSLDSWTDHRARTAAIGDALDEVLLQPLAVIDESVRPADNGRGLQLPFEARAMFDALPARHKFLYVGALPQGAPATAEQALAGNAALPLPPAGLAPTTTLPNLLSTPDTRLYLYDAVLRGQPVRVAVLERSEHDGAGQAWQLRIQVAESSARREQARHDSIVRELWQLGRTLVVTALLVVLGVSWTLAPLARLRDRMRRLPPGEPAPIEASEVPHEVAPLVDAVNLSIERYRGVLQEQERFLADAAHQLRTPVAVMMTQVTYAQRAQEPAAAREALGAIGRQLQRSRRIADQLLAMSHAVTAEAPTPPRVDLQVLAREAVLDALPMAQAWGVDLGWDGDADITPASEPALPVQALPEEVLEILGNLLHNALRHTPAGGAVTVSAGRDGGLAFVDVVDTGPGIETARREAVFERFHSRSRTGKAGETAGAGLGLAIARTYARRRGGDVRLLDAPAGAGLRARLQLPLALSS